jgi:parallel beta-helix repeat protein
MRTMLWILGGVALSLGVGCGDDGSGGAGGNGGAGGEGGSPPPPAACDGLDLSGCDLSLGPTEDDTTTLQQAFIEGVDAGGTICLCPGEYAITAELSVDKPNLTVRGVGASRDDVVLDFLDQTDGDDGLTATSDGFVVEKLTVKNTPGNGIVVTGADGVVFRDLKVSWDAGSVTENGAYAVYPVSSKNVLVEDCEIVGAADAGVYVGQSENIIVRRNKVYANVAGIEIENSTDAEVYENEAYDNTAGVLVFTLPNLEKKDGINCDVHDNQIYDNNRENFAVPGTVVAAVPPGTGVLILSADETHVRNNSIVDNDSVGVIIVSFATLGILLSDVDPDPETDPDPEGVYVVGNTFMNNGPTPAFPLSEIGVAPLEDVVWDGVEKMAGSGEVCLSMEPPTFRNINGIANLSIPANHSTDTTPHECDRPLLPAIVLP